MSRKSSRARSGIRDQVTIRVWVKWPIGHALQEKLLLPREEEFARTRTGSSFAVVAEERWARGNQACRVVLLKGASGHRNRGVCASGRIVLVLLLLLVLEESLGECPSPDAK
jgi:hypothetical protein